MAGRVYQLFSGCIVGFLCLLKSIASSNESVVSVFCFIARLSLDNWSFISFTPVSMGMSCGPRVMDYSSV